ncbi:hypothetical protein B835_335 [Enterococcus mundtii 3F]|uniref:helix-turn-helix domain-containing protein n=1 Tax=Enterococcus mundtii TaxID=53346 RepID=UPI000D3D64C6|nr:helix-turn-helix transcriptional regulator [Enterococcus mundtii]MDA9460459.1 hypothetical protein [Enterococcus mundtii 3F]PTO38531.1 transcriptional regulator [Enterococcus mundtii]PTO43915.1 transcriptional regulator [Enterococcus mundtii]
MVMPERIQHLRKTKGLSQEELADTMGVSRQAVSKWESGQSTPDLEKIILMSEFFGVTTDYILKGIETVENKDEQSKEIISKILYISSTAFVAIGLFSAFSGWYAEQALEDVWGSMIIQAVGIAGYFIGKLLSKEKAPLSVDWLNIIGIIFMPVSMFVGYLSIFVFNQGQVAPYPIGMTHTLLFGLVLFVFGVISFIFIKNKNKISVR